jgi:xylan 1,4-beta-xylosidase
MTKAIRNPILPGFHPDPSICRAGDDFYIANSTFQWWPGVALSHSRDLANWELVSYALTRRSQLGMERIPDSGGIWAPCLSYNETEKLFYLIYTNVNRHSGRSPIETPNYLVTAKDVRGPWSEPVFLNRSGFDPSLFHDTDGRTWLVNMYMDDRPARKLFFAGTLLQEYSKKKQQLIGPVKNIFLGTELGVTEGPHIFKRNGWYYLITAEGGTGYGHAMTMARAQKITGLYEVHPQNPIMTARGTDLPIQKAGHGQLVETALGEWYGVFLCGRPRNGKFCILGRETGIERGQWRDDGWFYFDSPNPRLEVPAPQIAPAPAKKASTKAAKPYVYGEKERLDNFDEKTLGLEWNTLRSPLDDKASLKARPSWLRLYGQPYPIETDHGQALVARRIEDRDFEVATLMEYKPDTDPVACAWQSAGLVCFYSHTNYYWLRVARDEKCGVIVELMKRYGETRSIEGCIEAKDWRRFHLRVTALDDQYQFAASRDGKTWIDVGAPQDGNILSDESSSQFGFSFTGAYVGMAAIDLSGGLLAADFDWFKYCRL